MSPQEFILDCLAIRLQPAAMAWLEKSAAQLRQPCESKFVFAAFSSSVRHSGKGPLALDDRELAMAKDLVPGWNPKDWTLDEAARIHLLLCLPPVPESAHRMDLIYQTADLGEGLALMKALPLLPNPLDHLSRAREGARSNVKSQFEAVALRNPYPADHFDEIAWNQLISKAVFVDSPLDEIVGLDRRANAALKQILVDLIKERRAAGRGFSPLIFRCMGAFAGEAENL